MLDLEAARRIALTAVSPGIEIGRAQELRGGWSFLFQTAGEPCGGSAGVVVNKHGGSLTFETETGRGTTFFIRLPIDASEARPKQIAA